MNISDHCKINRSISIMNASNEIYKIRKRTSILQQKIIPHNTYQKNKRRNLQKKNDNENKKNISQIKNRGIEENFITKNLNKNFVVKNDINIFITKTSKIYLNEKKNLKQNEIYYSKINEKNLKTKSQNNSQKKKQKNLLKTNFQIKNQNKSQIKNSQNFHYKNSQNFITKKIPENLLTKNISNLSYITKHQKNGLKTSQKNFFFENTKKIFQIELSSQKEQITNLKINHINTRKLNTSILSKIRTIKSIRTLPSIRQISTFNKESQFTKSYSKNKILTKIPNLKNLLSKTMIKPILRAKMINWIISVIHNYPKRSNDFTIYRSVLIMDLFIKNYFFKKIQGSTLGKIGDNEVKSNIYGRREKIQGSTLGILQDSDLHLIGITSMYIASKYEDIYHIPIKEFFLKVGFKKFSYEKIKEKEAEILDVLNFNISCPCFSEYIDFFIFEFLLKSSFFFIKKISYFCHFVFKIILFEDKFYDNSIALNCLAVLVFVLRNFLVEKNEEEKKNNFFNSSSNNNFGENRNENFFEEEKKILENIFKRKFFLKRDIEICCKNIELTYDNFDKRFPGCGVIFQRYKKYEIKKINKIF